MTATEITAAEEFDKLVRNYWITVECTAGTGARGSSYVGDAHEKIVTFVRAHPEFASLVPKLRRCADDGRSGTRTALAGWF
jgi:hypothetical protein